MSDNKDEETSHKWQPLYEIRLQGELSHAWASCFCDFEISCEQGLTILKGQIPDQAAFHCVLNKIVSLGLTIVSIQLIPQPGADRLR